MALIPKFHVKSVVVFPRFYFKWKVLCIMLIMCILFYYIGEYTPPGKVTRYTNMRRDTFTTQHDYSSIETTASLYMKYYRTTSDRTLLKTIIETNKTPIQIELPYSKFSYPLEVDMHKLVHTVKNKGHVDQKPIFVYPYYNIFMPICKCGCSESWYENKRPFLLLLVKSSPGHFSRREAIRETWGNESLLSQFPTKRVFLIGTSVCKTTAKHVMTEAQIYNDILLLSYQDAYYNNTLKTIGGLNWAVKFCNNTKYVLFIDDDFYMNPVLLVKHLNTLSPDQNRHLFLGKIVRHYKPQREKHQKWYMPMSEYPYVRFPPFLSAGFMALSMELTHDLQIAIPYTKKFKFDDVFLAIVIKKLGVTPQNHAQIVIAYYAAQVTNRSVSYVLASHGYNRNKQLKEAWAHFKTKYRNTII